MRRTLYQKIETGKRLAREFHELGIPAQLNEKSGEVSIKASDFIKAGGKRCPECGARLILMGKVVVCPKCDI